MSSKCGFISHVKGAFKIKAHLSLDQAIDYAKTQAKTTVVMKVCPGNRHTPVLARCKAGYCSEGLNGLRKRRKKARRK